MAHDTLEIGVIVERLEKIEKQNRRFKQMGLGLVLVVGSQLLIGQAQPQSTQRTPPPSSTRVLEAEKLILRDPQGRIRVEIDASLPTPGVRLIAEDGTAMAEFLAKADGTVMRLSGPGGKSMGIFLATADGPQFALINPDSKGGATLRVTATGPSLALTNPNGKVVANFLASASRSSLVLSDPDLKRVAGLVIDDDGPTLALSEEGNFGAQLALTSDGPSLHFTDPNGFASTLGVNHLVTPTTGESHRTSVASLIFFDNKQNVIWTAP